MDNLFEKAISFLGDIIGKAIDLFIEYLIQPFAISLVTMFRDVGDRMFSNFMTRAIEILQKSPNDWNSSGWGFIINNANIVFVAFGSQLVLIFFLVSFFNESIDPHRDVRIETIIKALIKILLAQALVVYSADIIQSFFGIASKFMLYIINPSRIGSGAAGLTLLNSAGDFEMTEWTTTYNAYDKEKDVFFLGTINDYLKGISGSSFALTLIAGLAYMVVMIGAGGVIVYTAYMRFFKIMLIVPYGAIASATVAGNHGASQTAVHYYKYVGSVVLEAVTMIMAIGLYRVINLSSGFEMINLGGDYAVCDEFVNRALLTLLLVGAVKGAGALTQKALS